jgi:hypothetical protein
MLNTKSLLCIILISLFYVAISWIANNIIITETFYFVSLENIMSIKRIEELIDFNKKNEWLTYILLPVINTIKYSFAAMTIFIGMKLFELEVSFKNCFKIILFYIIVIFSILISHRFSFLIKAIRRKTNVLNEIIFTLIYIFLVSIYLCFVRN